MKHAAQHADAFDQVAAGTRPGAFALHGATVQTGRRSSLADYIRANNRSSGSRFDSGQRDGEVAGLLHGSRDLRSQKLRMLPTQLKLLQFRRLQIPARANLERLASLAVLFTPKA